MSDAASVILSGGCHKKVDPEGDGALTTCRQMRSRTLAFRFGRPGMRRPCSSAKACQAMPRSSWISSDGARSKLIQEWRPIFGPRREVETPGPPEPLPCPDEVDR